MKHKELLALAQEAGKSIKSGMNLTELRQMLSKMTIEAALDAELEDHLDHTEDGNFELVTPRDRACDFEPQRVRKHGNHPFF